MSNNTKVNLQDHDWIENVLTNECKRLNLKKGYWGALCHQIAELFLYYADKTKCQLILDQYFKVVVRHTLPCNKCRPHYNGKIQLLKEDEHVSSEWYCDHIRNPINQEQGKPLIPHNNVVMKYMKFMALMSNYLSLYQDTSGKYWCHATHSVRLQVLPQIKPISDYLNSNTTTTTTTEAKANNNNSNVALKDVIWIYILWQYLFIIMVQSWITMTKTGTFILCEFIDIICDLVPNAKHGQVMKEFNTNKRKELEQYPADTIFDGNKLSNWFISFYRYYLDTLHFTYPIVILQLAEYNFYQYKHCIPAFQTEDGQTIILDLQSRKISDRILYSIVQTRQEAANQQQQQQQQSTSYKLLPSSATTTAASMKKVEGIHWIEFGFKLLVILLLLFLTRSIL